MKTEVKKIEGNKREINIEVNGELVKNKFEQAFKKIAGEAKVPGFRLGHAPRDILEKNFSASAHELVLKELIPDIYNQAIEKEGLDVIELPEISEVKLERTSLSFKALVEIRPEIKLKDYKGAKLEYKKISVSSDEIKRNLESMKEARKLSDINDDFAKSLSYPNIAELEKAIERQIYLQKENAQRQKIEQQILESITKDVDFKVPQSMVNRQVEDLLRQTKLDLALKGVPREKIETEEKQLSKELLPEAERQVRVYLILAEIAKKENIPADSQMAQHVIEFLLKEADWKVQEA
jgi:FKBP-type peptidyl-prolyl cis-trans isomerase (trigger factor)